MQCDATGPDNSLNGGRSLIADSGYRKIVDPLIHTIAGDAVDAFRSQHHWNLNLPSITIGGDCFEDDDDEIYNPWKLLSSTETDGRSDVDSDVTTSRPLQLTTPVLPVSTCRHQSNEMDSSVGLLDCRVEVPRCAWIDEHEAPCEKQADNDGYCLPIRDCKTAIVMTSKATR